MNEARDEKGQPASWRAESVGGCARFGRRLSTPSATIALIYGTAVKLQGESVRDQSLSFLIRKLNSTVCYTFEKSAAQKSNAQRRRHPAPKL